MERPLPGNLAPADPDPDQPGDPRLASHRLAAEFYIAEDDVYELMLGFGSETAVRELLLELCWKGELERREAA